MVIRSYRNSDIRKELRSYWYWFFSLAYSNNQYYYSNNNQLTLSIWYFHSKFPKAYSCVKCTLLLFAEKCNDKYESLGLWILISSWHIDDYSPDLSRVKSHLDKVKWYAPMIWYSFALLNKRFSVLHLND